MVTKASTDIVWEKPGGNAREVIDILIANGWSGAADDKVWYLPLGDNDAYRWVAGKHKDIESILKELSEKERIGEPIGIELIWKEKLNESIIGGQFLFNIIPYSISINWNITRKPDPTDKEKTDFQWYEPKVINPLLKGAYKVISMKSEDENSSGEIIQSRYFPEAALQLEK